MQQLHMTFVTSRKLTSLNQCRQSSLNAYTGRF